MSDSKDSSTLGGYVNSAVGAGQDVLGSLTGNSADKSASASHKASAEQQKEDSHSVGRLGPISATPAGGVSVDDPNRQEGSWNQTVGSAKASLGGLLGAEGLKREGEQQNAEGKGQEAQGQLSDYGEGVQGRVKGAVGSTIAGLTGDREKEDEQRIKHDDAKAKQRGVEADLQKQAGA